MSAKRKVEIFSAECPVCREAIEKVKRIACPSCDVVVLNMADKDVSDRAMGMGIRSVPTVLIDGRPADCCAGHGPDEAALRTAGLGQQSG